MEVDEGKEGGVVRVKTTRGRVRKAGWSESHKGKEGEGGDRRRKGRDRN